VPLPQEVEDGGGHVLPVYHSAVADGLLFQIAQRRGNRQAGEVFQIFEQFEFVSFFCFPFVEQCAGHGLVELEEAGGGNLSVTLIGKRGKIKSSNNSCLEVVKHEI